MKVVEDEFRTNPGGNIVQASLVAQLVKNLPAI